MKFSYATALATIAFATQSLAQDLSGLPTCAESAAIGGIGATGCALTDIKCICQSTAFLATVSKDIMTSCSAADQAKTIAFAQKLCGSVGVTIPGGASSSSGTIFSTSAVISSLSSSLAAISSSSAMMMSSSSMEMTSSTMEMTSTTMEMASSSTMMSYSTSMSESKSPTTAPPVVYTSPMVSSTMSTMVVSSSPVMNSTMNSTSTVAVPTPTYSSGAGAKVAGIMLSAVVAGVAALAL